MMDIDRALVGQLIEFQATHNSNSVAVRHGKECLSYSGLEARSRALAHSLRTYGACSGIPVGVAIERSLDLPVSVLGVLRSGAACLPLDIEHPADRIRFMLEDVSSPFVLVTRKTATCSALRGLEDKFVFLEDLISGENKKKLPTISADNLAYILFTSGSTGKPKGIAMPHRSLACLTIFHLNTFSSPLKTLQFASLGFDVSFQEMFTTWCSGGELVLIDDQARRDIRTLLKYIDYEDIERIFVPFVVLNQIASTAKLTQTIPIKLQEVVTAGESLHITPEIRWFFERLNARLHNQYGPTETHVVSCLTLDGNPLNWPERPSIGKPLPHVHMEVIDKDNRCAKNGVIGEIVVGGDALADGYFARSSLTKEKFKNLNSLKKKGISRWYCTGDLGRRTEDGEFEFIGRIDNQIKIRGYRVEPDEVAVHLRTHPLVNEAAVIGQTNPGQQTVLIAYYVSREEIHPRSFRLHLSSQLPDYMIPTTYIKLNSLPLNINGKLSHSDLPNPFCYTTKSLSLEKSRNLTQTEKEIAGLCSQILFQPDIDLDCSFLELGGDSLTAMQLSARILNYYKIEIEPQEVLSLLSIRDIAQTIDDQCTQLKEGQIENLKTTIDSSTLSPLQEGIWFLEQFAQPDVPYTVTTVVEVFGTNKVEQVQQAFHQVINRHSALRTCFPTFQGKPFQRILNALEVSLEVVDLRSISGGVKEVQAKLKVIEDNHRKHRFDLACLPLFKLTCVQVDEQKLILVLSFHHSIIDGQSINIVLDDLMLILNNCDLPPTLAYSVALNSWKLETQTRKSLLANVKRRIDGAPTIVDFPVEFPHPVSRSFRLISSDLEFTNQQVEELNQSISTTKSTLFTAAVAITSLFLKRITSYDDLLIATPVSLRNRLEFENIVGPLINTLIIRTLIDSNANFLDLLISTRNNILDAFKDRMLPFEHVVTDLRPLRDSRRMPISQVMVVVEPQRLVQGDKNITIAKVRSYQDASSFDLVTEIRDGSPLSGSLKVNADIFSERSARSLAKQFEETIALVTRFPKMPISQLLAVDL